MKEDSLHKAYNFVDNNGAIGRLLTLLHNHVFTRENASSKNRYMLHIKRLILIALNKLNIIQLILVQ